MSKFILIDQSLRSVGGHPCDYALHVLRAVEQQGYTPVLVTHQDFRRQDCVPRHWAVLPCFRHSSYSRYALCSSGSGLPPVGLEAAEEYGKSAASAGKRSIWNASYHWHRWRRQTQLRRFGLACEQVFAQHPLEQGDQVFFATASEFDLLGLSKFLQRHPAASNARWHLQFHFGIYEGRPSEYEQQQTRADWVRSYFQAALGNAAGIDLRFYNTSTELAQQYNKLGVVEFIELPYPINPATQPSENRRDEIASAPLRVTCGGGFRAEKGHQSLAQALSEVWESCFASGRMQLQIQAKRSKWRKLQFPHPAGEQSSADPTENPAVKLIPHPLEMEDYVQLIRESDIGLLMYDSRRYYARRAGVLCEFLCAGVPVIVPAGCWLSEQIAEAGFEHLDQLVSSAATATEHLHASRFTTAADKPGVVTTTLDVPQDAGDAILSFHGEQALGSFLRIELEQFDAAEQRLSTFCQVVGQRAAGKSPRAMWRIDSRATSVRLTLRDAFAEATPASDVQLDWLPRGLDRPLSSVGLVAADEQHFGRLLREMGDHYPHYRRSALQFSQPWRRAHDPRLTVAHLTGHTDESAERGARVA